MGRVGARISRMLVATLLVGPIAFVAYMSVKVPVTSPGTDGRVLFFCAFSNVSADGLLPRAEITQYWRVAVVAAAFVALVAAAVVVLVARRAAPAARGAAPVTAGSVPAPLLPERIGRRTAALTAFASVLALAGTVLKGYPLWIVVLGVVVPWVPLVTVEAAAKYERYGAYAIFGVLTLLQVGHMGEHSVQVLQLAFTDGSLARSHGVFGALDFETIHFVWDSAVWLVIAGVLLSIGPTSRWLWVAFAASSVHEVEHLYLFWVYERHFDFYLNGGLAGIMGYSGLIGSPLARPYLHFTYNYIVIVPLMVAFWRHTMALAGRSAARPAAVAWPAFLRGGARRLAPVGVGCMIGASLVAFWPGRSDTGTRDSLASADAGTKPQQAVVSHAERAVPRSGGRAIAHRFGVRRLARAPAPSVHVAAPRPAAGGRAPGRDRPASDGRPHAHAQRPSAPATTDPVPPPDDPPVPPPDVTPPSAPPAQPVPTAPAPEPAASAATQDGGAVNGLLAGVVNVLDGVAGSLTATTSGANER